MKRNHHVVVVALLTVLVASACNNCSSSSSNDACKDFDLAQCERFYKCNTGAALDVIKQQYGPTVNDCLAKRQQDQCAAALSDPCPGKTFDNDKFKQCAADNRSTACSVTMVPSCQGGFCK